MSSEERSLIGISKLARQKVIDRLQFAYANDYLDQDDFEKRLDLATNTRNRDILAELVDDIPEIGQHPNKAHAPAAPFSGVDVNRGEVTESEKIISIFSGAVRKGKWHPPRHLRIVAVMGGIELDFSEAIMPPGGTEIEVFCVMGGLDIRVPEGIHVDARPVAIMGGVDNHAHYTANPGGPTVKIRGFVFMGGVDIKPPRKQYFRKFLNSMFSDRE